MVTYVAASGSDERFRAYFPLRDGFALLHWCLHFGCRLYASFARRRFTLFYALGSSGTATPKVSSFLAVIINFLFGLVVLFYGYGVIREELDNRKQPTKVAALDEIACAGWTESSLVQPAIGEGEAGTERSPDLETGGFGEKELRKEQVPPSHAACHTKSDPMVQYVC